MTVAVMRRPPDGFGPPGAFFEKCGLAILQGFEDFPGTGQI